MNNIKLISEAIETLRINKLRTALAMLGIIIGIGSVISLVSLGQGTQASVKNQIQALGANLLTIMPGSRTVSATTTLTIDDANVIGNSPQITTIQNVSPEVQNSSQLTAGANNTNISVIGAVAAYRQVHNISMQSGMFISDADNTGSAKVIVLGPKVAADLFPTNPNPIGLSVRIKGISFQIVGVTVAKGGSGFGNQDNVAYIPLKTAQRQIFGQTYLSNIAIAAKSPEVMTEAKSQVGFLLLSRHKISDPAKADFTLLSQQEILNSVSTSTQSFTSLLSGIAAISLLVGGIGIMNIMLVTVTERTREIGLRKALGAKRNTIITQFLTEAMILTFAGGIIGVILGIVLSFGISSLNQTPFVLSPGSILLAFMVSGGIGVLFGWYPAQKAAGLEPIEALRYE